MRKGENNSWDFLYFTQSNAVSDNSNDRNKKKEPEEQEVNTNRNGRKEN